MATTSDILLSLIVTIKTDPDTSVIFKNLCITRVGTVTKRTCCLTGVTSHETSGFMVIIWVTILVQGIVKFFTCLLKCHVALFEIFYIRWATKIFFILTVKTVISRSDEAIEGTTVIGSTSYTDR
jgi:hypothetical protein